MPHLSPLKWFWLFILMIIWMSILLIKMNFLFIIMPQLKNKSINSKKLNWKI